MAGVTRFLERRLKLKVNREKSAVARPVERTFLGFSLTAGRQPKRRIAPPALARFKGRVRELTRRTGGKSLEQSVQELSRYLVGWRGSASARPRRCCAVLTSGSGDACGRSPGSNGGAGAPALRSYALCGAASAWDWQG